MSSIKFRKFKLQYFLQIAKNSDYIKNKNLEVSKLNQAHTSVYIIKPLVYTSFKFKKNYQLSSPAFLKCDKLSVLFFEYFPFDSPLTICKPLIYFKSIKIFVSITSLKLYPSTQLSHTHK